MKIELAKTEIIHFVGIGGIGMSGLALIMEGMGFKIQGSDISLNKKLINTINEDYMIKKRNMKKFSYQNTWNNINKKLINTINED